jgi:glycosyltransferase involved in cell wall biosynthesis
MIEQNIPTDQQIKTNTRVAIVHDFFFQNGGAENVVEKLLEIYPDAEIYTTIFIGSKFENKPLLLQAYAQNRIKTTWLQGLFCWQNNKMLKYFKHFFWLYPVAMRFVKVKGYGLVIISSTDCAKQIRVQNVNQLLHYCHSPTRYLNGLITETDHQNLGLMMKTVLPFFIFWLRKLDHNAVKYLNKNNCIWIANSEFIRMVVQDIYKTESVVIYPPVEIQNYLEIQRKPELIQDFYLCHGRVSFHKRIDLAITTCLKLGKKLKISGTSALGSQMNDLQKIVTDYEAVNQESKGLIEFLGRTTDEEIKVLMSQCKGFLFPGKEDFGITPIEVLAAGVPIIAYQAGGALEYIQDSLNGIFFPEQTVDSLAEGIFIFEKINNWNIEKIKNSSKPFSGEIFTESIKKLVGSQTP